MSLEQGNKRKSHDEREEAIGAILSARDRSRGPIRSMRSRTSARNLSLVRCHPPLRADDVRSTTWLYYWTYYLRY